MLDGRDRRAVEARAEVRGDHRAAGRVSADDAPIREVQRELALLVGVVGDDGLELRQRVAVDHAVLLVDDEEAAVLGDAAALQRDGLASLDPQGLDRRDEQPADLDAHPPRTVIA